MTVPKLSISVIVFSFIIVLSSCSTTGSLEKADEAYDLYQFTTAINMYKKVYKKTKDKKVRYDISVKTGNAYRQMSEYKKAETQYKKAQKYTNSDPICIYNEANMMRNQEKYEEALIKFKDYAREVPGDIKGEAAVKSCEDALKWKAGKTRYVVENFKPLNSRSNDYAPVFYKRGAMIYTSDMEGTTGGKIYDWTGESHTDLFIAEKSRKRNIDRLEKPVRIDEDEIVNTKFNEGTATFDKRMSTMYYTQCNDSKGKGHNCRIYVTRKKGKVWGEPEVLNFCNDSFTMYAHPTLSPDGNKLYFVSDMEEGGQGGLDIWVSSYVKRGRTWGDPVNLGSVINTAGNEMFPFAYTNKRLYFSSDQHPGIGGLDIFYSEKDDDGKWSEPINMKSPINSGGDDFGIIVEPGGTIAKGYKGYFSSNRPGSRGDDIYRFYMTPLEYNLSGTIFNLKTKAVIPGANVVLIVNDTLHLSAVSDNSGYYSFKLDPENEYAVSAYKKYFFDSEEKYASTAGLEFSEDFVRDLYLDPFITEAIELEGIYYDLDKYDLRPESMVILDSLYNILMKHPYIVIELASHTDCRATYEYNMELSNNRAQSVVDYLVWKGIPLDRLEPKGYGETQLVNNCSCENGEDPGLDCTEDEHQQNRRTTFQILRTDYEYGSEQLEDMQKDMPEWMKKRYKDQLRKAGNR